MNRKRVIVIAVIAIAIVSAIGIWAVVSRPERIAVILVKPAATEIALSVVGRARPADLVQITSQNAGQVISLLADDGDQVASGAPLAVIRATVEQAQTQASVAREAAARAEAVNARRNYNRTRFLAEKGYAAKAALDTAEAQLKAAEANIAAASAEVRANAERAREFTIRAPMRGTVLVRPIDNGQVVESGEVLFEMGSDSGMEIWAEVDETYADDIKPGMTARAAFSGSARIFMARVIEVSPRIDSATGGRQIKLVPDGEVALPPGRSIDVTVILGVRRDAVVIPRKAIVDATADPKVYVVDSGDVVRQRPVEIMRWPSVNAIVQRGLKAGDRIVADPASVRNDQQVRPVVTGGR